MSVSRERTVGWADGDCWSEQILSVRCSTLSYFWLTTLQTCTYIRLNKLVSFLRHTLLTQSLCLHYGIVCAGRQETTYNSIISFLDEFKLGRTTIARIILFAYMSTVNLNRHQCSFSCECLLCVTNKVLDFDFPHLMKCLQCVYGCTN